MDDAAKLEYIISPLRQMKHLIVKMKMNNKMDLFAQ